MKNFTVLLFAIIAISYAGALGPLGGLLDTGGLLPAGVGGNLLGGDGPTELIKKGAGITSGLTDGNGAVLNLGAVLGLDDTTCIALCPMAIADTKLKCVKPTTFPTTPICYGKNTKNKWIFPCQDVSKKKKKPKKTKKDDDEEDDE